MKSTNGKHKLPQAFKHTIVPLLTVAGFLFGGTIAFAQFAWRQAGIDTFSSINLSAFSDQTELLPLSGTNMCTMHAWSDAQLAVLVGALGEVPTIPFVDLPKNRRGFTMGGTFWSLEQPGMPPLPADTIGVNVWPMSDGSFLLDDFNFDYEALSSSQMQTTAMASGNYDPPPPGDSGDGTNSYAPEFATNSIPTPNYGTNLWIAQTAVASGHLTGIGSNTLSDVVYTIQSLTDLLQATNGWQDEGTIVGSQLTNWTPLSVAQNNRTNLFIRLRSELSSDGSGIPDWWAAQYGVMNVDPNALDSAGDGYTIYQKYELNANPNTFLTPQAPQGFTANYYPNMGTVTLNWLPSPGPITGYNLHKTDYQSGQNLNIPISSTSLSYTDSIAGDVPNLYSAPFLWVNYAFQAKYTNGNSASAYATLEKATAPSANVIIDPQGRISLIIPNPPNDLSNVCICRALPDDFAVNYEVVGPYGENALTYFFGWPLNNGNFNVNASSITNGICQLPDSQIPPFYNYSLWVRTMRSNGVASNWSQLALPNDNVVSTPFIDARQQLKDNLRFLLRAADDNPFAFAVNDNGAGFVWTSVFANPWNNYVFAGFYGEAGVPYLGGFDEFEPVDDNCFYRNFVFDQDNLDPSGLVDTGCSGGGYYTVYNWLTAPCLTITNYPAYYFNGAAFLTNNPQIPSSQLASSQTQWILPPGGGVEPLNGGTISGQNFYGLTNLSAQCAFVNTNNQLVVAEYNPSQTLPSGVNGVVYMQTAQPILTNAGYYFARPNYDPVPEQGGFFSPTTPAIVVGVGTSQLIAGYAEFGIENGYPDTYAYLGQYFQQANQIDANGNVTANTTGILSPFGDFYATQPGPAALVTMADVDPPYQQGTCTVYCVSLQLDKNHDGNMDTTFNGPDSTSTNSPYVFWCNNNFDRLATNKSIIPVGAFSFTDIEQDDQQVGFCPANGIIPTPDCNYNSISSDGSISRAIPCTRDLEDFARLWVCGLTTNLLAALPAGSTVSLSWGDVNNPNPANPTIDLFMAADADGGIGYQTNEAVAVLQTNTIQCPYIGRVGPGQSIQLSSFDDNGNPTWLGNCFIWCGVSNGTGGLTLTIADADNNVLAQTTAYIQIVDIKQMYERWTVGDNEQLAPTNTASIATDIPTNSMSAPFHYPVPQNANIPYILFVHGYNLPVWKKNWFAEAEYKRLYWQGYQGRFGLFRWPTTVQTLTYPQAFDDSEAHAWESATGLLNLLTYLNTLYPGNVFVTAHSHGTVVAGEALRLATEQGLGPIVNTYVAMQGALDSHTYDPTRPTRSDPFGTPDRYGQYYTNGAPCYFSSVAGAGAYVNFFNTNDWALNITWIWDQNHKPDLGYAYSSPFDAWSEGFPFTTPLVFPTNTYTIFSYCDQAHAYAIGMQPNVGGAFLNGINYNQIALPTVWPPDSGTPPYSAHVWHSAEFRSDNAERWQFWNAVLTQMKLK